MSQEQIPPAPDDAPVDPIHAAVERLLIWVIQAEQEEQRPQSA